MLEYRKIRTFCFLVLFILITFGGGSCGKKMYPSGLEVDLLGYNKKSTREQWKRKQIAHRTDRRQDKSIRKGKKLILKEKKLKDKELKVFKEEHFNRQHPDVQARMKQNFRDTKRNYASRKSFKDKFAFWQKNKC
jgi:hypothetical protein